MKTKDQKRQEAAERQAAFDKLTPVQKLARAIQRGPKSADSKEIRKWREASR